MITNNLYLYLIAGGVAVIFALILFALYFFLLDKKDSVSYDEQLNELLSDEIEGGSTKVTLWYRWAQYWGKLFKEAGWSRYAGEKNTAGRDVIVFLFVLSALGSIIIRNIFAGIFISFLILIVITITLRMKIERKSESVNTQLPGFIFALKANIQSGQTAERAILKVIDGMPSPLYEDLYIVKQRILASSSFKEALEELEARTNSKDLKFLAACMKQASGTGSTLEDQLTVIQKVISDKKKASDEQKKAARNGIVSIWVSAAVTPISFIGLYFMNADAQRFWFVEPVSWAALAIVGLLYALGIMGTRKLVNNIKDLV
jgi:tight adherence protein B